MAKIFIDAYADMLQPEADANGILLAPSKIQKGKTIINFTDFNNKSLSNVDICQNIQKGLYKIIPLTMQEWLDFFTPYLQNGDDIVFFTVSQKIMQDGGADLRSAFTQMSVDYPDRKCYLIDTMTVSRGTSEIALMANTLHKNEPDIDKVLQYIDQNIIGTYVSAFVIDDVNLVQSSPLLRNVIDKFVGASVGMRPIICIDTDGDFRVLESIKGFKPAVAKLYDIVADNGENIADYTFTIVNFDAQDDADKLYNKFRPQVESTEIRNLPMSLNNAIMVGGKTVAITFHSKK